MHRVLTLGERQQLKQGYTVLDLCVPSMNESSLCGHFEDVVKTSSSLISPLMVPSTNSCVWVLAVSNNAARSSCVDFKVTGSWKSSDSIDWRAALCVSSVTEVPVPSAFHAPHLDTTIQTCCMLLAW